MEKLVFLGIGSNSLDKLNTSSFAVELNKGEWMLVDCGPDIPRQVTKAAKDGISFLNINYVLVTHRHLDHCLGLPYFLVGRNLERQARSRQEPDFVPTKLHIIAEGEVWKKLQELFSLCHPDIGSLGFEVEHLEISSFMEVAKDLVNVKLQTFIMDHAVPAYGFVISYFNKKKLAYSTDTLPTNTFIQAASGVEILIHEAMVPASEIIFSKNTKHSTTKQAGEAIARIKPIKAFLMHIRPIFWDKRRSLEKEVLDVSGFQAEYPDEGSTVDL